MLKDLVIRNRSYRGYDRSVRLPHELLTELVDLCCFTASSMNRQALRFHIAEDEEEVSAIQALTGWAMRLPELHLPYPGTEPTAFIVIAVDTSVGSRSAFQHDVGIAAQTMLLRAAEEGFGGCMLGTFRKKELSELLSLPDGIEPDLIVAFGKPDERIVLTDAGEDGSTGYYRSADGRTHFVPKLKLEDILI